MSKRIDNLREKSFKAVPSISVDRARVITRFYRENEGKYSPCMMRACTNGTLAVEHVYIRIPTVRIIVLWSVPPSAIDLPDSGMIELQAAAS